jgi:hypothetical protein
VDLAAKLDSLGKPAWIALTILGFWFWWPLGLAALAYLIGSGRMAFWRHNGPGRWYRPERAGWSGCGFGRAWAAAPSGNSAFDEYRTETLRRLEEEQREFAEYLQRLRRARDKAEFDQFMAERHQRGGPLDQTV